MRKTFLFLVLLIWAFNVYGQTCGGKLPAPLITNAPTCANPKGQITITLSGEPTLPTSRYVWEQSEDGSNWHHLAYATKVPTITKWYYEFDIPGVSDFGSNRYIRVKDSSCPSRTSDASEKIEMIVPPPDFSVITVASGPTCRYWPENDNGTGKDGKVTILMFSGDNPSEQYMVKFKDETGIQGEILLNIPQNGTKEVLATDFRDNNLLAGIAFKPGAWIVTVMNNLTFEGTPCETSDNFVISNPPQISATEAAGHKDLTCNESTTEGTKINLSISTTLWKAVAPLSYTFDKMSGNTVLNSTTKTPSGGTTYAPEFTGLTEGTYRIKITDSRNCAGYVVNTITENTGYKSIEIKRPSLLDISATLENNNGYQIACRGGTGTITAKAKGGSYTTSLGSYQAWVIQGTNIISGPNTMTTHVSDNTTKRTIFNQSVGTYKIRVQDGNGCVKETGSLILNQPPTSVSVDATAATLANGYNLLCPGDQNGNGTITSSGGLTPYTYRWETSTGSLVTTDRFATTLSARKYKGITWDKNGCTAEEEITVTSPPAMVLETSVTSDYGSGRDVSCFGSADGSAKVVVTSNPNPPYDYEWLTNGDDSQETSGLAAGTHTVKVYNKYGCVVSKEVTLDNPPGLSATAFVASNYNGSHISCFGEDDAALDVTANNSIGLLQYEWTLKNNPANVLSVSKTATGLGAGIYKVKVTDANNCSGTSEVSVTQPSPLNVSIEAVSNYNGEIISCSRENDGVLAALADGGTGSLTYLWNNGFTGTNPTGLSAGEFAVVVTDKNNCSSSASFNITDPPLLEAEITFTSDYNGQPISCAGKSDAAFSVNALGGTGDYAYLWNDNATTAARSGQSAGGYSVYVSDENGCIDTAQISVPDPDPVLLNLLSISNFNGYGVSCHGETDGHIEVTAQGGTGVFSYQWTDGPATNAWSHLGAGAYSVTVQDQNGCDASEIYSLTEADPLELSVASIQNVTCFEGSNGSVTLSASGGAGEIYYSLDNVTWQPEHIFTGLIADSYSFSASDQNECLTNAPATILEPEKIEISFVDVTPAYCAEARGSARAEVSGGTGELDLAWTDRDGMTISNNDLILDVYAGVYTLTVTDVNSCEVENSVGISSIDGATVSVRELQNTLCYGSSDGRASLEIAGNGPFTIQWPDGQSTEEVTNLKKGIYIVKVTDVNDCENIQTVEIGSPSPIAVNLRSLVNASCFGDCNGSIEIEATGGNGVYQYDWSNNETGLLLENLCTGVYDVIVTDKNNCIASESFNIASPSALSVSLQSSSPESCFEKCDGKLKVLAKGGTSGYNYTWSNNVTGAQLNNLCKSEYLVTVTDANNCMVAANYLVTGPELLSVSGTSSISPTCMDGCDGSLSVIASGGNGGYAYQWVNGISGIQNNNLCPGSYSVTATDKLGCVVQAEFTLENQGPVTVDMEDEVTLCEGQIYKLDAGNFATYQWTSNNGFTASTRIVEISEDGLYKVEVTTAKGCTGQAEFLLQTSKDLLEAQFLTVHEAFEGDTLVLINVTWPVADNIEWEIPDDMEVIGLTNGDLMGKFDSKGTYAVGMHASLGLCYDYIEKTIDILEQDESETVGGRLGFQEELLDFTLAPNPTTGVFNVSIELAEVREIFLSVINGVTGKILTRVSEEGKSSYSVPFNLAPLGGGVYVLRLDMASGTHYLRFIVE